MRNSAELWSSGDRSFQRLVLLNCGIGKQVGQARVSRAGNTGLESQWPFLLMSCCTDWRLHRHLA